MYGHKIRVCSAFKTLETISSSKTVNKYPR